MSARDRGAAFLSALAVAVGLGACGKSDGGGGGNAPEGATGKGGGGLVVPPMREKPDGVGWDALSFAPEVGDGSVRAKVVDVPALRADVAAGRSDGVESGDRQAWAFFVRRAGIEASALRVIASIRIDGASGRGGAVYLARMDHAAEAIGKAARARGAKETAVGGAAGWKYEPEGQDGYAVVAVDGWLVGGDAADSLERALAAHGGKRKARDAAGIAEGVRSLPQDVPIELEAGGHVGDFGAMKTPPQAVVSQLRTAASGELQGVAAFVFRTDAERAAARPTVDEMLGKGEAAGEMGPHALADRGPLLVFAMNPPKGGRHLENRAKDDLRRLRGALRRHRTDTGKFPTTAEGLAALEQDAEALDEFLGVLPKDPWGRPYHYKSPHPKRPDDVDLRSTGADGQLDTEDDVLPEE